MNKKKKSNFKKNTICTIKFNLFTFWEELQIKTVAGSGKSFSFIIVAMVKCSKYSCGNCKEGYFYKFYLVMVPVCHFLCVVYNQ